MAVSLVQVCASGCLGDVNDHDLSDFCQIAVIGHIGSVQGTPPTHLCHGFYDGYAECGEAVHYGNTNLKFSDLAVRSPCHQPLAQQFHTVHPLTDSALQSRFGFDAASAVISAPASPQGAAHISLRIDRIVTSNGIAKLLNATCKVLVTERSRRHFSGMISPEADLIIREQKSLSLSM